MNIRFKTFMRERTELSTSGEERLLSVSEYYGVKPRKEAFSEDAYESRSESLEGYRKVFPNDLVMNYMLAWKGAYGISNHTGIVSPAYSVFKIDEAQAVPKFIHYNLRSEYFKSYFRSYSKGIIESRLRLYPDTFLSLFIDLPPQKKQKDIADFLDCEISRIDQLIQKKLRLKGLLVQREINAVKEYMQDLQSSPDVKLWKLSHVCRIQRGKFGHRPRNAPELYDGDAPFLQTGDVARAEKFITSHKQTLSELGKSVSAKFPKGTLLMAIAANVGDLAITTYEAYCPDSVVGFIPDPILNNEFLYYALRFLNDDISSSSTSNAQDNTNIARLGALKIPLPSMEKQMVAVNRFRDIENITYDISSKIENSIDRLIEFKCSLITEAVTGQLDIQAWQKGRKADPRLDLIEEEMQQKNKKTKKASA